MLNDNLRDSQIKDLLNRVRDLETRSPMRSASVTDGNTNFIGNESLTVTGSQKVSGWLIVTGTLKVVGAFLLEGVTTITGAVTITGNMLIDGLTTLTKRLTVTAPGDIRVGGAIPMTIGNATVAFDSGGSVVGYSGGVRVASGGTPDIVVSTGGVSISGSPGNYFTVSAGGLSSGGTFAHTGSLTATVDITANGRLLTPNAATTTSAANTYMSSAGSLLKVTSAARFKIDPLPMDLPDTLLDVEVKSWIDLGNAERFAELCTAPRPFTERQQSDYDDVNLKRVPGVIAEEVEAAGGEPFVTRDADGLIQGVAYDRLALARTEILSRKLDAAMDLIAGLQRQLLDSDEPTGT